MARDRARPVHSPGRAASRSRAATVPPGWNSPATAHRSRVGVSSVPLSVLPCYRRVSVRYRSVPWGVVTKNDCPSVVSAARRIGWLTISPPSPGLNPAFSAFARTDAENPGDRARWRSGGSGWSSSRGRLVRAEKENAAINGGNHRAPGSARSAEVLGSPSAISSSSTWLS